MSARSRPRRSWRPGHDVVVLDDLTTGHRGAVPDGATLHQGSYADAGARGQPARDRADRGHPPLRGALAGRRIDRGPGEVLPRQRRRRASRCSRRRAPRGVGGSSSPRPPPSTASRTSTPIPEDARSSRSTRTASRSARSRAPCAWYGRAYGLRSVTLRYFNVAGATEALGEDHDPETHLIPNVLAAAEGDRRADRSSVTTTRPRTAPASATTSTSPTWPTRTCGRSKRPRPATRGPTTPLVCNLGNGGGFSVREVLAAAEARRRAADPVHRRAASRRRSAGPRRPSDESAARRPSPRAGGRRSGPASTERSVGLAPWRLAAGRASANGYSESGRPRRPQRSSGCRRNQARRAARRRGRPGRALGGASAHPERADFARPGPVVADRPDQPQPDEHRHEQAQDRDLVRAVARCVSSSRNRMIARTAAARRPGCPCRRARRSRRTRRSCRAARAGPSAPDRRPGRRRARCPGSRRRRGTATNPAGPKPIATPPMSEPDRPRDEDHDERPLRALPVAQPAPHEAHRDRDERQATAGRDWSALSGQAEDLRRSRRS